MDMYAQSSPIRQPIERVQDDDDSEDDPLILDEDEDILIDTNDDDSGWDTDLEGEGKAKNYIYPGSKEHYREACKKCEVVPTNYFMRNIQSTKLKFAHHGLGEKGVRALCMALVTNTHVCTLDLKANDMGDDGTRHVCAMLRDNLFITDLDISENNIGEEGILNVCHVLQNSGTLRKLSLRGNKLGSRHAFHLAESLGTNQGLRILDLSENQFDDLAGQYLGPAISENEFLTDINLGWNQLRLKGAMAVGQALRENSSLKKVNLSWNGFGDDGMLILKQVLQENNIIEELDLSANRITQLGADTLSKGLAENNELRILRLGQNQLLSEGALSILKIAKTNSSTSLIEIDFSGIQINQSFMELLKEVNELLPKLIVYHGGLGGSPQKAADRPKPMKVLRDHIQKNNMRVLDFFKRMDKDASKAITIEEFVAGLQETGIPLRKDELTELVTGLDKDGNGEIDYQEMVIGSKEIMKDDRKEILLQRAKAQRENKLLAEAMDMPPPSRVPSRADDERKFSLAPGKKMSTAFGEFPARKNSAAVNSPSRKSSAAVRKSSSPLPKSRQGSGVSQRSAASGRLSPLVTEERPVSPLVTGQTELAVPPQTSFERPIAGEGEDEFEGEVDLPPKTAPIGVR